MNSFKKICLVFLGSISFIASAQEFDANLQIRPRYEYRNGYKTLISNGETPASFISQRSRLNLNFKQEKLKLKLTLQNIRTWGDVATTSTSDTNGVALFEAWAQYDLNSNWSARFGRQVLSYDNQRIMGEIDWVQQGQSHDALLVSYHAENQQLDLGLALNSDKENLVASTTAYTTTYKSMQYAWYHTQMGKINTSLLFLNTGYEYTETNLDLAVDYKQTFGTYLSYKENKWDTNLGLYGQTGKSSGSNVSAWYAGINLGYAVSTPLKATLGYEFLSGKSQDDGSGYVKSFTPIFGTNHGFNGFMDYFYVSNHQNNVGLHDVFLKLNYTHNKWQFAVTPHVFSAAATVLDDNSAKMDSYLGTELDFNLAYAVQKDITASAGYSQMFASNTLERVKGITDSASTNNWAWVMISINPRIFTFK